MNEQLIARRFSRWLKDQYRNLPLYYLKVHGHRHQRVGVADYWLTTQGRSVKIELKGPDKKPMGTPIQERELRLHSEAGGDSWVCTDLDASKAVVLNALGIVDDEDLSEFIDRGVLRRVQ